MRAPLAKVTSLTTVAKYCGFGVGAPLQRRCGARATRGGPRSEQALINFGLITDSPAP